MDTFESGAAPVGAELRDSLLEPLVAAARAALGEMAGAELVVRVVSAVPPPAGPGDVTALVRLTSPTGALLVLRVPAPTAAALAARVLGQGACRLDADLLRDCVGEIANVVAGQAKTLLAGTTRAFTFALPEVTSGPHDLPSARDGGCLAVTFGSDRGELHLLYFLRR